MEDSNDFVIKRERWFSVIFLLLLGIHLYWMGTIRVHPFVDVPYHLAESTIYRYYDDPGNEFAHYYSKKTEILPNTFYMLFCASPLFPSVEFANRVFFCLYVLLFPISIFLIIRQLNGNVWFSLLSFLMLYNFNVHWGFGGFLFSIPVFFLFFLLLLRSVTRDSFLWGILRCFWLLFLFFIHGLTGLFSLMFFFLHSIFQYRKRFKILAIKSLVALPLLLVAAQWWFFQHSPGQQWSPEAIHEYFTGTYLENLNLRVGLLINDNKWLYPESLGKRVALLLTMFILIPVIPLLSRRLRERLDIHKQGSRMPAYLLLFSSLACWLIMPGRISGQSYIFDRFSVFFLLAIIILLGSYSWRLTGRWKVWILTGCLIHCFLWSDYFYEFEKDSASFNQEILPAGGDDTLCALIYDKRFRGRNIYQHFPLYYIVWKQGIVCARFIDMRYVTLIRRKAGTDELPRYSEELLPGFNFKREYRNMDYLLVRQKRPSKLPRDMGEFRLVRTSGRWLLYQGSEDNP